MDAVPDGGGTASIADRCDVRRAAATGPAARENDHDLRCPDPGDTRSRPDLAIGCLDTRPARSLKCKTTLLGPWVGRRACRSGASVRSRSGHPGSPLRSAILWSGHAYQESAKPGGSLRTIPGRSTFGAVIHPTRHADVGDGHVVSPLLVCRTSDLVMNGGDRAAAPSRCRNTVPLGGRSRGSPGRSDGHSASHW